MLRRMEDAAVENWREGSDRGLPVFDGLPWPPGLRSIRGARPLDSVWLRAVLLEQRFGIAARLTTRVVNVGSAVAGWSVLAWLAYRNVGLGTVAAAPVAFGAAALAWLLRWLIFFRLVNARTWLGVLTRSSLAASAARTRMARRVRRPADPAPATDDRSARTPP